MIDVHFFLLSPTREYWADIVPEKKIDADSIDVLHFEVGNQLLASMGKLGRDFFSMIVNKEYEEFPSFRDPGEESLLTTHTIRHPESEGSGCRSEKQQSRQATDLSRFTPVTVP
ncbi:MAG: exodeoxyribonuclease V subunit gamma [Rhodopseudomonas palustris]|nr:exodeoxyribonuclease V subunit gamma [Rhodopseudomonas palustris]